MNSIIYIETRHETKHLLLFNFNENCFVIVIVIIHSLLYTQLYTVTIYLNENWKFSDLVISNLH